MTMKKLFKYILSLLLCATMLLPSLTAETANSYVYEDGYTTIGNVTIPFPEYMPGSYFTKNGYACTCHDIASINCVASGDDCNCLRFVTVDGMELDLLAVQCIGFARYCFYRIFGFTDHDMNSHMFYNAGTLDRGYVTADSVKSLFGKLKPGAHIRYKLAYSQHSVILLNQTDSGFTVYHANAGGNGVDSSPCVISTRTYTWESFANTAYRGIVFAHMPNEYPDNLSFSDTPIGGTLPLGVYVTTSNLNLRSGVGTSFESIAVIPKGTSILVTETSSNWGRTSYNGLDGWVSLAYAEYEELLTPRENSGITVKDGYIYGIATETSPQELLTSFINKELTFSCGSSDYVGTGTVIGTTVGGYPVDEATVIIEGDVNGDGLLTSADCVRQRLHLNGQSALEGAFLCAADFDGNGTVNTVDYKGLQREITFFAPT